MQVTICNCSSEDVICPCCGEAETYRSGKFVDDSGQEVGWYHATLRPGDRGAPFPLAIGLASVGPVVCLSARPRQGFKVTDFPGPKERACSGILTREEALAHPAVEDVFTAADLIVKADPVVRAFYYPDPALTRRAKARRKKARGRGERTSNAAFSRVFFVGINTGAGDDHQTA